MENCDLIITHLATWHRYGYHVAFHFRHISPEDGRSRLKRVGMDVWMNSLVKTCICVCVCVCVCVKLVVFILILLTTWSPGPFRAQCLHCTPHSFVHSEIKRSIHNGFVCFMWFPERLFSYTTLIFFCNLSRVCLLRSTNWIFKYASD